MKFHLNELKQSSYETCKDNKGTCHNQFIGPIHNTNTEDNTNTLFFISPLETKYFSLTDYSYKVTNETNLNAHFLALFPYQHSTSSSDNIIYNIKEFRNIGTELSDIKIIPGMFYKSIPVQNGIMLKYINGDKCITNPAIRNSAYIMINCDSTGFYSSPTLKFITEDQCTYVFEWNNRFGCPVCLRKDIEPIYEGCINGMKRTHYTENLNCIIPKDDNQSDPIEYNNDKNILYYDNLNDILIQYLTLRYNITTEHFRKDFTLANLTIDSYLFNETNHNIYVENRIEQLPCVIRSKLSLEENYTEIVIITLIGIAYVILITCLIYLFFKYKRVSEDYIKLKQDNDPQTSFPNTELEMANI